jgi:hypothetical protein
MFLNAKTHKVKDFINFLEKNYKVDPVSCSIDTK